MQHVISKILKLIAQIACYLGGFLGILGGIALIKEGNFWASTMIVLALVVILRARDETIHDAEMEALKFCLTHGQIKSDVTLHLKMVNNAEWEEKHNIQ